MENIVVLLVGYPGVGKLTISKELTHYMDNVHILDNHMFNNLIFPMADFGSNIIDHPMWKYIRRIKRAVYDFVIEEADKKNSFILTGFFIDDENDIRSYNNIVDLAKQRSATFIPVKLVCDINELMLRVESKVRKDNYKLSDADQLSSLIEKTKSLIQIEHTNKLELDVTNMRADEAAKHIFDHICDRCVRRAKSID